MHRSLVVLLLLFVFFDAGCAQNKHKTAVSAGAEAPADEKLSLFSLIGNTPDGRKKWQVQGETARLREEVVDLSPVRAVSYGQLEMKISANKGRYYKGSQNMHLEEDVVATTSDGAVMTTNSFDWSAQKEMGTTSDWVTVTRADMTAHGRGAVSFPKMKRVRLEKEVTVTFNGQKGKTVVNCDGPLEVDYSRGIARFWRHVRVQDPSGLVLCDRMDARFDPTTKHVQESRCWGHVKIHHEDQMSYSNRAIYWQNPPRTRLIGHPKMVMAAKKLKEKDKLS